MNRKKQPVDQNLEKASEQLTVGCVAAILVWLFVKHRIIFFLLIFAVIAFYLHRPVIEMLKEYFQ